jgi:exodeoxyribonuclease VII large subunit
MTTGEILSVSALNQTARLLLEEGIGTVWLQGEISNFSMPSSGHWYFSLKDAQAQVRAAMFINKNRLVSFEPKSGMQVLALAQVSLYENRGEFQLIVEKLEPIGQGNLQLEFERLSKKLSAEGLFEARCKKPLPPLPQCIGLITSATGAALRDLLHVLKRRAANIPIIIYPTSVQGAQAAPQIVQALHLANQRKECDVIIIARGGGSLEDLWPFNEEIVARAVFASEIPIISGVGHEVDFTLCDWVADVRAPTPSAAAEIATPDRQELINQLQQIKRQLIKTIEQKIASLKQECDYLRKRLQHPKDYLQQLKQQCDFYEIQLKQLIEGKLESQRQTLRLCAQALNNLNPLTILNRGYAIALDEHQQVMGSVTQFKKNQIFSLRLHDGEMKASVIDT